MASDNKPQLSLKLHKQFGNGPVKVVCLHGFFGPEVFDKLYDRLAETVYSVYVFSIYGYMYAEYDSSEDETQEEEASFRDNETALARLKDCTFNRIAQDLFVQIDLLLRLEKFHLVTHNFGAAIAMKVIALCPSRVMSIFFINPCGIIPKAKDTVLTRTKIVQRIVETNKNNDDEIYDDEGNFIEKEVVYEDVEVKFDIALFPEKVSKKEKNIVSHNLHVLWDNYMIKLINIVECNCPAPFVSARQKYHDKFVANHFLSQWKDSNLVSVAKDLPIRAKIIVSKDDPLSNIEESKKLLDLFAKKKSVLGKYEPKCSKVIALEEASCGHLSPITNVVEIEKLLLEHLPKK